MVDDSGGAALDVIDACVARVPIVDMAFDEVAQTLIEVLLEGRCGDLLHAVVGGFVVADRTGEIEVGVGVLVEQFQPRVVAERLNRLATERGDFIGAFFLGDVFHVAVAKRLVTVGDVVADIRQQAQIAETVAEDVLDPGIAGGAAEGIETHVHLARGLSTLWRASDDVDHPRHRLRAEQQTLPTLEHFDAFDGVRRQGVQVQAAVQAVVQAHAVEQDQRIVVAPAQQGISAVVERAVFRGDIEAGNEHLHDATDIRPGAGALDLFAADDVHFAAVMRHVGDGRGLHRGCRNDLLIEFQSRVVGQQQRTEQATE